MFRVSKNQMIRCVMSIKESNFNENGSKFSHLLTVRGELTLSPPLTVKYSLFYESPIKKRPKNQFSEMGCFTLVEITCSRGVVNGHNDDRFVAIIVVTKHRSNEIILNLEFPTDGVDHCPRLLFY